MTRYLLHLSDLHIRAGDIIRSRYNEYHSIFSKIVKYIQTFNKNQLVCFITGDVFHHKCKIESPGIKLFWFLLSELSCRCSKVFIIRGNHDFKQESPDEPDLIGSLLHKYTFENVVYLDKTGVVEYENLSIGTMAIQDVLAICSTSGTEETYPDFPIPSTDPSKTKVALFHGTIKKRSWLDNYDIGLLGDIHLQQVLNADSEEMMKPEIINDDITVIQKYQYKKGTIAYAGSTIQQDFGETLLGHGFLVWDLEDKKVTCHHANNSYGYVTLDNDNRVQVKCAEQLAWLNIKDVCKVKWFPEKVYLRGANLDKAEEVCIECGLTVQSGSIFSKGADRRNNLKNEDPSTEDKDNDTLYNLCKVDSWISYVDSTIDDMPYKNWKEWLKNPNTMKSEAKTKERFDKLSKKIDAYMNSTQAKHTNNVKIIKMKWEWMLCFNGECNFDFTQMDGNINVINGLNGKGKTSFLECITIGLYGEGFPSRYNKNYTSAIINKSKPPHAGSYVCIEVEVNSNEKYQIRRSFHTQEDKSKIHAATKESYVKDMVGNVIIAKGKSAIDKWVETKIGTLDSFLTSGMLTQSVDRDFFNLNSVAQKQLLDKALNISACSLIMDALKDAKLAVIANVSNLKERIDDRNNTTSDFDPQRLHKLQECVKELQNEKETKYHSVQKCTRYSLAEAKEVIENHNTSDAYKHEPFDSEAFKLTEWELKKIPKEITQAAKQLSTIDKQQRPDVDLDTVIKNYNIILSKWGETEYEYESNGALLDFHSLTSSLTDLLENKPNKPSSILNNLSSYQLSELDEQIEAYKRKYSITTAIFSQVDDLKLKELSKLWKDVTPPKFAKLRPEVVKKQWTREYFNKLSHSMDYDIEQKVELVEYLQTLKDTLGKSIDANKELIDISKQLSGYKDHPYNPQCDACNRSPWRTHFTELQSRKKKLTKILESNGSIESQKAEISELTKQLEMLDEFELIQPALEYKEYQEYVEYDKLTKQVETNHLAELIQIRENIIWKLWNEKYLDIKNKVQKAQEQEEYKKYIKDIDEYGSFKKNKSILQDWACYLDAKYEKLKRLKAIDDARSVIQYQDFCNLESTLLNTQLEIAALEKERDLFEASKNQVNEYKTIVEESKRKIETFEILCEALNNYQTWIYKEQVLPIICRNVNKVLEAMNLNPDLRLNFKFHTDGTTIDWFLGSPPLQRASGFQKFIVSLGMRIALSKIGASEIRNKQLFLDEGFTACDYENLSKVPEFLRGLLSLYDSIVLVTHLEELKDSVDKTFDVATAFNQNTWPR